METREDYYAKRAQDMKGEHVVADYLDTYFYPTWTTSTTRNYDVKTQVKGVDITVTSKKGYKFVIDEKAAIKWANNNLQTFALEIDSVNGRGELYNGWFMDATAINDYWLFVWLDVTTGRLDSKDDIKTATVSLVKKTDMYEFLQRKGVHSEDIKQKAAEVRTMVGMLGKYYMNNGRNKIKGFKITLQTDNWEQATNILVRKDDIINSISTYSVQINNGKVIPLRLKTT